VATALTVADVPSNLYALQRNADIVALVTIADIQSSGSGRILTLSVEGVVAGDAESEMEALVDERRHFGRHYAVGESLLAILTSTDESPGLLLQWPPLPIDVDEQYAISERIAGGTIEDLLQLGTPASHRAALAWALETAPSDIQQEVLFRAVDQLYAVPDAEDLFRDIIDASAHILPAGDRANLLAPFAESFIRHDTGIALYSAYAASPAHHWLFESGLESRYVHARAAAVACAGMLPDEAELIPRIEEMAGVETSPVVLAAMPEALLAKGAASGLETLAARLETPSPALVPYVRLAQGLSPTPERFTDLKLAVEEGDSSAGEPPRISGHVPPSDGSEPVPRTEAASSRRETRIGSACVQRRAPPISGTRWRCAPGMRVASRAPLSGEWLVSSSPYQRWTGTAILSRASGHRPMARTVSRA